MEMKLVKNSTHQRILNETRRFPPTVHRPKACKSSLQQRRLPRLPPSVKGLKRRETVSDAGRWGADGSSFRPAPDACCVLALGRGSSMSRALPSLSAFFPTPGACFPAAARQLRAPGLREDDCAPPPPARRRAVRRDGLPHARADSLRRNCFL